MVKKSSLGRQKIDIKKIANPDARQVCFSKRRSGLFKKAAELSLLCDALVAIIVFSPAGKVFTFGHPSVDSVIERYLRGHRAGSSETTQLGSVTRELSRHCCDLMEQVETEKKRNAGLQEKGRPAADGDREFWWEADVGGYGLQDLEEFKMSLEKLRDNVLSRADDLSKANMALVDNYLTLI